MAANENKGRLMDVGNRNKQWDDTGNTTQSDEVQVIHPGARDALVERYGMIRKAFFCPSNLDMDTDYNWSRPDKSDFGFVGYVMYGGRTNLGRYKNDPLLTAAYSGFDEAPMTFSSSPPNWASARSTRCWSRISCRSYQNELNPSNHVNGQDPTGYMPKGKGGRTSDTSMATSMEGAERPRPNRQREQGPPPDVSRQQPLLLLTQDP